jgi:hypothetical protein|tara:strand:+ start:271 stop:537 length:267 start_codon:yes stop_codon:yes gene_type:complete
MALVERTVVTKVEVVSEYKHIQIQTDNQIIDDETGEIKAKDNFHRKVIHPGDDYSNEPDDVKVVADAVWTEEIIKKMTDFRAAEAARE